MKLETSIYLLNPYLKIYCERNKNNDQVLAKSKKRQLCLTLTNDILLYTCILAYIQKHSLLLLLLFLLLYTFYFIHHKLYYVLASFFKSTISESCNYVFKAELNQILILALKRKSIQMKTYYLISLMNLFLATTPACENLSICWIIFNSFSVRFIF